MRRTNRHAITTVCFERFADEVGMPIVLLLRGTALILLGLGTGRLARHMTGMKQFDDITLLTAYHCPAASAGPSV